MRKTKTIKIDNVEITIKELTVRQIWALFQQDEGQAPDPMARLDQLLTWCCPELSRDKAMDLAPSELRLVWEAFESVNADFLEIAKKMGLGAVLDTMQAEIASSLGSLTLPSAPSSPPVTAS